MNVLNSIKSQQIFRDSLMERKKKYKFNNNHWNQARVGPKTTRNIIMQKIQSQEQSLY